MSKTFNVDEYLQKNAVTIKINGKSFEVKDVPYEVRDKFDSDNQSEQTEGLKILLGCGDEDLKGYGFAATSAIISHIMENLFPSASRNTQ